MMGYEKDLRLHKILRKIIEAKIRIVYKILSFTLKDY